MEFHCQVELKLNVDAIVERLPKALTLPSFNHRIDEERKLGIQQHEIALNLRGSQNCQDFSSPIETQETDELKPGNDANAGIYVQLKVISCPLAELNHYYSQKPLAAHRAKGTPKRASDPDKRNKAFLESVPLWQAKVKLTDSPPFWRKRVN